MQIRTILDQNLQENWYFLEKRVDFKIHPFEVKYCSIRKSYIPFKSAIYILQEDMFVFSVGALL